MLLLVGVESLLERKILPALAPEVALDQLFLAGQDGRLGRLLLHEHGLGRGLCQVDLDRQDGHHSCVSLRDRDATQLALPLVLLDGDDPTGVGVRDDLADGAEGVVCRWLRHVRGRARVEQLQLRLGAETRAALLTVGVLVSLVALLLDRVLLADELGQI